MSNINRAAKVIGTVMSRWDMAGRPDIAEGIDRHLAIALADAGLLAPDLPEPDVKSANNTPVWRADGTNPVTCTDGLTPVRMWILDHAEYVYTPYAARAQANTLRAAAEYAEKENNNE